MARAGRGRERGESRRRDSSIRSAASDTSIADWLKWIGLKSPDRLYSDDYADAIDEMQLS